jgi:hypothetical protein
MPSRDKLLIQNPLRLSALALALAATVGVRAATGQTVIVRSAPPAATIELTLDSGPVVSATADSYGDATLAAPAQTAESEAKMYIDSCGTLVRVLLVRLGPAPPRPGCTRTDIGSVFIMRRVTTFVVDLDGPSATAHVTQGPAPREWVERGAGPAKPARIHWGKPEKGLALSAGAGFSTFSRAVDVACGNAPICQSSNFGVATALGAEYWIMRFLAAHVSYVRPADVTVNGSGSNYRFDSQLQTRMLTVGAKVGGGVGPARLYGLGGLNRHEATSTTTETVDDVTVVVDGVTQTIKGGTQSFGQKSVGWNWLLGGGVEAWFFRWVAFYGEVSVAKMKNAPTGGGEGGIDDRALIAIVGARVRIGR